MSNTASTTGSSGPPSERRVHSRQALKSLAYVEVGAANGGVILNIGEGGLALQAVSAIEKQRSPRVRFQCEPSHFWIESEARVAWTSETQTMVGLEFVKLPDAARKQIREWIDFEIKGPEPASIAEGHNKWSRVVSENRAAEPPNPYLHSPAASPERADTIATLKRYLVDERNRILLHDLVMGEAERLCTKIASEAAAASANVARGAILQRLRRYEELTQPLLSLMTTGCYWGELSHDAIWSAVVERVAGTAVQASAGTAGDLMKFYPALLLVYGAGISAVSREKYSTLQALLVAPRIYSKEGEFAAVHRLVAKHVLGDEIPGIDLGDKNPEAAASVYLHHILRPLVREYLPSDADYDEAFDRFEYLTALVWVDENPRSARLDWVPLDAPSGKFIRDAVPPRTPIARQIDREIEISKAKWPPLRGKMFGGHVDRVISVKERYDEALEERLSGEAPPERY
ncbi:MAG TPA: PilZ domain-containing protein [Candidatus Acidoferrales bacterium]|nr:PilZ domain-containing protein [Candidatus Acidoferrales bacterium]